MSMNLWDLIDAYRDETGATEAAIQRRAGLNHGTFTAWRQRGVPTLPSRTRIFALAKALNCEYEALIQALLRTAQYLPEEAARKAEVTHYTGSGKTLSVLPGRASGVDTHVDRASETTAAREGVPQDAITGKPQRDAGEENQDDGGMDPS